MLGRRLSGFREWNPAMVMFWVILAVPVRIIAQPNFYGISILTHYGETLTGSEGPCRSITQDGRGVLYVASDDIGILEYDGVRWETIPDQGEQHIHTLVTGEDGVVYVGSEADFGCLLPDSEGTIHYISLADSVEHEQSPVSGNVYPLHLHGKVYFCSPSTLFEYDPDKRTVTVIETPENLTGFFGTDSLIYLTNEQHGLMTFDGTVYQHPPGGAALRGKAVSGLVRYDGERLLLATLLNGLLLYDPETGSVDESFVDPEIQRYLQEGRPAQLIRAGDGFAVATENSGIVLLDWNGSPIQVINGGEGLPDPHVAGLYSGPPHQNSGPLWIAHGKGISKLDIRNPLTTFTEKSGFEGQITDMISFSDRLFLATTNGLYIRDAGPLTTGFRPVADLEGEEIRKLHVFRPSRWASMLLVSSPEHTWLVNRYLQIRTMNERMNDLGPDSAQAGTPPGRFLAEDPQRPNTIFTGSHLITGLEYSRRGWSVVMRTDFPANAFEKTVVDRYGFLWTSTPENVIRLDISRLSHVKQRVYSSREGLPAGEYRGAFLDPESGTILLGTENGFYRFDYFTNRFYRDTLLNLLFPQGENLIHAFYRDPEGVLWISFENNHCGWGTAVVGHQAGTREMSMEKPLLRLHGLPTEMFYSEQGGDIWFSQAGNLYHLDHSLPWHDTTVFSAVIRKVTLDSDVVLFRGAGYRPSPGGIYRLTADQEQDHAPKLGHGYDSLTFEWAAPSFDAEDQMMFSTRMEGLEPRWSEWSAASSKVYGDLPSGVHIFRVRARNIYGEISESATFMFRIRKPWYGSLPALLIYIILAAGGVTLFLRTRIKRP